MRAAMSRSSVSAKSTSTRRFASRTWVGTRLLCVRFVPNWIRSKTQLLEELERPRRGADRRDRGGERQERHDRDAYEVRVAGPGEHVRRRRERHAARGHDHVGGDDVAAAGRGHAVDVPRVLHLDVVDGHEELPGRRRSRRRRPCRSAAPSRRGRCRWRTASAPTACTCRRPAAPPGRAG